MAPFAARVLAAGLLALIVGCGDDLTSSTAPPQPNATGPAPTAATTPTASTTLTGPTVPPSPVATPEDGRRFLEERGVDPERLSEEVGEQMRRRFQDEAPR